ncbi:outer membrane beta-barrel protein [bacterium]|nr:outer membrane beta-barrel protein [bacterium]
MKKIVISTLAALIACPAFAGMSPTESSWQLWGLDPYIALRGGLGYTNMNYNFNGHKEGMTDMVWQGRAALGLEVCDTVRSEIEYSLYSKSKDHNDFGTGAAVDVHTKLQTLLFNTYMEFGDYQIVRPFVGVGAGIAFTDVKRAGEFVPEHSKSNTRFSAMGTLGVSFDMQYFAVDLAARYNYVDVASGLHNFGGDLGIRFMF